MPSPGPEARQHAERYRLGLADRPHRGPAGERLGKGTGASLEFQDRRAYVAGDDVRHLDWRAYARTDQLMVRLYREEVLPTVELVLDDSRSMAVDGDKARLAIDLAGLVAFAARAGGFHVRLVRLGERAELLGFERFEREGLAYEGRAPLAAGVDAARALLRPGAIRVVLSDFLSPCDPASLVRTLAARAGGLALVQVLGRADAEPPVDEALRLEDVESGAGLDLVLDRRTVERYRARLANLQDGLAHEARRADGHWASLVAGPPLEDLCRGALTREGVLVPA